jgi:hypothetical protein
MAWQQRQGLQQSRKSTRRSSNLIVCGKESPEWISCILERWWAWVPWAGLHTRWRDGNVPWSVLGLFFVRSSCLLRAFFVPIHERLDSGTAPSVEVPAMLSTSPYSASTTLQLRAWVHHDLSIVSLFAKCSPTSLRKEIVHFSSHPRRAPQCRRPRHDQKQSLRHSMFSLTTVRCPPPPPPVPITSATLEPRQPLPQHRPVPAQIIARTGLVPGKFSKPEMQPNPIRLSSGANPQTP